MEAELLQYGAQFGIGGLSVVILGILLQRVNKTNGEQNKANIVAYQAVIRADRETREQETVALTQLRASIDQFNQINGQNQKDCNLIREAFGDKIQELHNEIANFKQGKGG